MLLEQRIPDDKRVTDYCTKIGCSGSSELRKGGRHSIFAEFVHFLILLVDKVGCTVRKWLGYMLGFPSRRKVEAFVREQVVGGIHLEGMEPIEFCPCARFGNPECRYNSRPMW